MQLEQKRVVVVGLGRSGLAALALLVREGARAVGNDVRPEQALGCAATRARELGAELVLGAHPEELFSGADLVVLSPGVPPLPAVDAARARGVPVWSEVELASRFLRGTLLGITGTNGKSTVTSLIGAMCASTGRPTFVGGNLGDPLCDAPGSAAGDDGFVVVELSSFQLERVDRFRARVALLLNLSADHLDRYASFESYARAKGRIFAGQQAEDAAVVPDADSRCQALAAQGLAKLHTFGGEHGEVRIQDGCLVDHVSGLRVPARELRLRGKHNLANATAAVLAARLAGVGRQAIASSLRRFRGLPHRMQCVAQVGQVTFVDDSKATNVGAAAAALEGLAGRSGKVVLIAGGKHKGGAYAPLGAPLSARGRALVLMGEAATQMEAELGASGVRIEHAQSMSEAVAMAHRLAQPGDTVLLAPACSSFDMFHSYRHRGELYQAAVRDLLGVRA